MIIKPDPFIDNYIYEKQTNPDTKIVLKTFQRNIVDTVDQIVELAHGQRDMVRGESDWKVVEALLLFFSWKWPNEFQEFKAGIPDLRKSRNTGGYSDSKEIKYVCAIPPRFMKLVKAIFPDQEWDKRFTNKFIRRFPLFKIGGEQN
jgi:hypothetical protein